MPHCENNLMIKSLRSCTAWLCMLINHNHTPIMLSDVTSPSLMNEMNRLRSGRMKCCSSFRFYNIWTWQPRNTQEEQREGWIKSQSDREKTELLWQPKSDGVRQCGGVLQVAGELWKADGLSGKCQRRDENSRTLWRKCDLHTLSNRRQKEVIPSAFKTA